IATPRLVMSTSSPASIHRNSSLYWLRSCRTVAIFMRYKHVAHGFLYQSDSEFWLGSSDVTFRDQQWGSPRRARIPEIFQSISREIPCGTNQNGGLNNVAAQPAIPGATLRTICSKRIRLLS